jgi:predicted Rossmann fold flavoprotein
MDYDVIVIGAGASGMMCAGQAALYGLKVLLLEKMKLPGVKLRITGKGRCNITNIAEKEIFLNHVGPDKRFLYNVFSVFFSEELVAFFEEIGVKTKVEQGGRVFPFSDKATELAESMVKWIQMTGVTLRCNTEVRELLYDRSTIAGVTTHDGIINSNSVVVATGGISYPATGSTGDGYRFAKKAGHSVSDLCPMLVPLTTDDQFIRKLHGLHLRNVRAFIFVDGKEKYEAFGEMDFFENGVEGPIILSLSRKCIHDLSSGKKIQLKIDLKPALSDETLDNRLKRDIDQLGKLNLVDLFHKLMPSQLIPVFTQKIALDPDKKCSQITAIERGKILSLLKNFTINISGHGGYNRAIITGGGISVKEINPKTMESKLIRNLYFTGEVLDLDADTGGYNLQIAFSTGYLAGISLAEQQKKTS